MDGTGSPPANDTSHNDAATRRLELTLKKHWLPWYPKPTVVFDGRGNPAQWGTGTWMVRADGTTMVSIYLFNRLWKFGEAVIPTDSSGVSAVTYSAPWLPFGRGRIRSPHD